VANISRGGLCVKIFQARFFDGIQKMNKGKKEVLFPPLGFCFTQRPQQKKTQRTRRGGF